MQAMLPEGYPFHQFSEIILNVQMKHFVMVPLIMTYLHCLQHSLFEHLFKLYTIKLCALVFLFLFLGKHGLAK